MADPLDVLSDDARDKVRKKKQPSWTNPMLAKLTKDYFSDTGWLYERKLDGVRCLVFRDGKSIRIMSRNKNNMNNTYPELVDALKKLKPNRLIADGEIVAFKNNVTNFERLQNRIGIEDPEEARSKNIAVYLYLFDLLYLNGYDLTKAPLVDRKKVLKSAFNFNNTIRFVTHRRKNGEAYFEDACKKGWEGVIVKRADSAYKHSRSSDWLKFKCGNRQEMVIGGYTDPHGERIGFGALLIGYYDNGALQYAGKVGTGYDNDFLEDFSGKLQNIERKTCPFASEPKEKGAHWVTPKYVGEVGFTEWTADGKLRHPRFIGLRHDKDPKDVVREKRE